MGGGSSTLKAWEKFKRESPLEDGPSDSEAIDATLCHLAKLSPGDARRALDQFIGAAAAVAARRGVLEDDDAGFEESSNAETKVFRIAVFSTREYDRASFEAALERRPASGQRLFCYDESNLEMMHWGLTEHSTFISPCGSELECVYFETALEPSTAVLARGFDAICTFVNDDLGPETLRWLHLHTDVKLLLLRCAGFNNVDLAQAAAYGMAAARVPEYSPFSVAEHALALTMALNRKIHRAWSRTRDFNFSLSGEKPTGICAPLQKIICFLYF